MFTREVLCAGSPSSTKCTGFDRRRIIRRSSETNATDDAFAFVLEPPSVPGIGTGGGLKLYVQDRAGRGMPVLEQATWSVASSAAQTPGFTQAFTLFNTRTPQIYADIGRTKAELLQVPIGHVFDALSVYMGGHTSTTSTCSAAPTR